MNKKKIRSLPTRLENTRRRFENWRRTRKIRTRIPESLWTAAVKMAARYGIHQTAKALRVDYYSLKKRADKEAACSAGLPETPSETAFVELAAPVRAGWGEWFLELEDGAGAKMRVHLKGAETPDLAALSRSFWEGER